MFKEYLSNVLYLFFAYFMQLQLQALLETLSASEPHYIRCIKPNNLLKPSIFENNNVLLQLRCGVSLTFGFVLVVLADYVCCIICKMNLIYI